MSGTIDINPVQEGERSLVCLSRSRSTTTRLLKSVRTPIAQHGPQDVDPVAGEHEEGLVVTLPFAALACAGRAAGQTVQRAERVLVEHALDALVTAERAAQEAYLARLAEHGSGPGGPRGSVGAEKTVTGAHFGEELRRQDHPHGGAGCG